MEIGPSVFRSIRFKTAFACVKMMNHSGKTREIITSLSQRFKRVESVIWQINHNTFHNYYQSLLIYSVDGDLFKGY